MRSCSMPLSFRSVRSRIGYGQMLFRFLARHPLKVKTIPAVIAVITLSTPTDRNAFDAHEVGAGALH